MNALTTPVALFIFNRPALAELVFNQICVVKPKVFLLIADGPRASIEGEDIQCMYARKIIDRIDWPCQVFTNFSDVNLGCKKRISSGIDWVFTLVDEAIFLEDDCLPCPSFFYYCEDMLNKYRNDNRIGMVSGNNFEFPQPKNSDTYFFSQIAHIWGWATWKRAWRNYDVNMEAWPKIKQAKALKSIFCDKRQALSWEKIFTATYEGKIDTWDYQWVFTLLTNRQLSIMPGVNLISNIGFGVDATHTTQDENIFSRMEFGNLHLPLQHPTNFLPNYYADSELFSLENSNQDNVIFRGLTILYAILRKIRDKSD